MKVRVAIANAQGDVERCPEFTKSEITIGRTAANDVVVPDAGVSSAHARVLVTGGALTILDLESTNGTFVNEDPVRGPRILDENDQVQIGDFTLRFTLDGVEKSLSMPAPMPPDRPEAGKNGTNGAGEWPEPPPMMDLAPDAGSVVPAPAAPPRPASKPVPASLPAARPAMFPPLERVKPASAAATVNSHSSRPPQPPASASRARAVISEAFEFEPASADVLKERVFEAVWSRVGRDITRATPGIRPRVERLLQSALHAAARVGRLNPTQLREVMIEEMMTDGPLPSLLEGEPSELLIHGSSRVRINRDGHITEGPTPFTCRAAISALVWRLCGTAFDAAHPVARGSYRGYALEAIHEVGAAGQPIVSLRRVTPQGASTLEQLVQAGILSHPMSTLLSACVVGRQNILLASGPGATSRPVMAALMAAAPSQELQVAVTHRGVDASAFRDGTVMVTRCAGQDDLLRGALALGPDRLGVDDVQWTEAKTVAGLVARSLSLMLGVRAQSAGLALSQLSSMMQGILPPPSLEQLIFSSVDVIVATQVFADGVTRVTQISEPVFNESGALGAQELFMLVPGSRTWQYTGVTPRCSEELQRRGFPIDPSVFLGQHG